MKLYRIPHLGGYTLAFLSLLINRDTYAVDPYELSVEATALISSELATVCDQDLAEGAPIDTQEEENVEFNLYGIRTKPGQSIPITTGPLPGDFVACMREHCSSYDRQDQPYNGGINPALPKEKDPQRRDCRDFASDVLQCANRKCSDILRSGQCKVRSLGRWIWKCSPKKKRWELEGHNQLLLTCGSKSWIIEPQADPGSDSFMYDKVQGSIGIYPPDHIPDLPGAKCPPLPGQQMPKRAPWPPHYFFPTGSVPQQSAQTAWPEDISTVE